MLTLAQIKLHCRIDNDNEDTLLQALNAAALEYAQRLTDRNFYAEGDTIPTTDPTGMHITPLVRQAMLLMIGTWYANREADWAATGQADIPAAVYHLLQPYRIYGV